MLIQILKNIKDKLIKLGVDQSINYVELRRIKLLNVIVFSLLIILSFFAFLNLFNGRYSLMIGDIVSIILVCIPAIILQHKKKYVAARILVISSFFVFITFFSLVQYDAVRQTEHILLGACIIPIFMFDGWRKNLMFTMFVLAFYAIKIINIIQHNEPVRIDTFYIIYAITFLVVYVIANYFKYDLMSFNYKLIEENKTKDNIFQIISHDIRNPFSSLLGISELQLKYLEEGDVEKFEKTAKIINTASNRIYMLTQTLLDWSVTQSDQFKVNPEKLKINEILAEVIMVCSLAADSKNINLNVLLFKEIEFTCDKIMTQIAVRNILLNAIKFSERGSDVYINALINEDGELEISIKDSGTGITKEELNLILNETEIFSQFGTEKEKGSGIGLRMSNELIKRQDGKISVKSAANKGSEFIIALPKKMSDFKH